MSRLVSICTPTSPNRRDFLRQCRKYVEAQTYRNLEWVVVDGVAFRSKKPLFEEEGKVPIRHVQVEAGQPVGAMRNWACRYARGDVLVHFDDDDWYSPDSVEKRVALLSGYVQVVDVIAYHVLYLGKDLYAEMTPTRTQYRCGSGNGLAYMKRVWECKPFASHPAEDRVFVRGNQAAMRSLDDDSLVIYVRHGGNTCRFPKNDLENTLARVRELTGSDWAFYERLSSEIATRPW